MSLIKKPYELSVWSESLNSDGIKEEKMGAIIGAHDMSFLGKATNVVLKTEIKGTATLTFDMPSKFFDSEIGDYIHNELADTVKNESKIKLHYKDKWYEFYVKKITENKKFKAIMYSYSCSDSFIDELSRTGYDITFDDKLNNSVDEAGIFMEDILEQSVWDYTPEHNIGDFTEFNEQKFYKIPLSQFGGSITAYKIDLEVKDTDFYLNGEIKPYIKNYAAAQGLDWDSMIDNDKENFLIRAMQITNVLTDETRILEYGDDLARERELFWDCYYKDNGRALISEENKVELTGEYIYVPITDLSMIMGSIYEDAYSAVEEPALYGSYPDTSYGYALQPTSKNPRAFIQIINLPEGAVYHIDEEGVLADNDYHYVIYIEDWNNLLKAQLSKKEDSGLIYWKAPLSSNAVEKTLKYSLDKDGEYIYTTNATPSSSVIDDFNWYPVYYEGYLMEINGTEVTQARKISVTDRTEYNKAADQFVTVYNNKANEYLESDGVSLYTEDELGDLVRNGEEFRVCSKLQTRQILPTLARNLIQNGTEITDTNGWEAKTQNNNEEGAIGTGSYKSLMSLEVHPTLQLDAETGTEIDLGGTQDDEVISDYYLQVISPKLNKCIDFSKEGTVESDYVLNFGLISQEYSIEKDQVYAIRLKTGIMANVAASFSYRAINNIDPIGDQNEEDPDKNEQKIITTVAEYEQTMDDYYDLITIFGITDDNSRSQTKNKLKVLCRTSKEEDVKVREEKEKEIDLIVDKFYSMISPLTNGDSVEVLKKTVDQNLEALLFGGSWTFNGDNQSFTGLIPLYDNGTDRKENYEKISSIALKPVNGTNSSISYKTSDTNYLKYYLYNKIPTISEKDISSITGLTRAFVNSWKEEYISFNKIFRDRINEDLDKIVIGKGSLNNEGNYIIEGIDSGNEFISFAEVFDIKNQLYFVPQYKDNIFSDNYSALTTNNLYHQQEDDKSWSYSIDSPKEASNTRILDEIYLLFKANQTITNPYIGIKVESEPMKINFDSIEETIYKETTAAGVIINAKNSSNQYLDGVQVELVKLDVTNITENFKNRIGLKEDGTFNYSMANFAYADGDLKTNRKTWTGTTSVENPMIDGAFLLNGDDNKTYPYLVFVDNQCIGLIYLEEV